MLYKREGNRKSLRRHWWMVVSSTQGHMAHYPSGPTVLAFVDAFSLLGCWPPFSASIWDSLQALEVCPALPSRPRLQALDFLCSGVELSCSPLAESLESKDEAWSQLQDCPGSLSQCAKWMNPHHNTQAGLWAHSAGADGCTIRWVIGSGGASIRGCLGWEENDSGFLDRKIWLQHQLPLALLSSSPCPYLLLSWGLLAEGSRMPDEVS